MKDKGRKDDENTQSAFVSFAFTINSIIGAGVLGISWAYYKAGWTLGVFSQVFSTFLGIIIIYQLLQATSRVEVLWGLKSRGYTIKPLSIAELRKEYKRDEHIIRPQGAAETQALIDDINETPEIKSRRYDICEMTKILLGEFHGYVLLGILFFGSMASLTGYCSIFASSLASVVALYGDTCNVYDDPEWDGDCRAKYWIYLALFGIIVITLTLIGLTEQVFFQITMCLMRFVVILIMLITSLYAIFSDTRLDDTGSNNADPPVFEPLRLGLCLPIVYMATYFASLISTTTQYVEDKPKNIPLVCFSALSIISVLFLLLGLILPQAIDEVEKLATLNWDDYSAGKDPDDRDMWAYFIAYIVVLLPAFDVMSIYPLVAINVSDNMVSMFYGNFSHEEIDSRKLLFSKLLIALPPILIAFFTYDLSYAGDVSGSLQLLGGGLYIPLMTMAAKRLVETKGPYDDYFISDNWCWTAIYATIVTFILIWVLIILYLAFD